jgi:CRP-like cAMP-binding protein
VHRHSWPTRRELTSEVFEYLEGLYNRTRRHSRLGMLSPADCEAAHPPLAHAGAREICAQPSVAHSTTTTTFRLYTQVQPCPDDRGNSKAPPTLTGMPTHIGTTASDAMRLAELARQAYDEGLSPHGGFLPPEIPLTSLPGPLARYVEICRELPGHYNAPDAHVKPWLGEQLRGGGADEIEQVSALTVPQCHLLMTVVGLLAHAYRWDSSPPRPEERLRTSVELPDRLAAMWWHVSRRLGVPCVGSLYHFVLSNWRLRSRPEGGRYANGELAGENLELAFHYLQPPADREERAMFISIVESEARGAEALRAIVALLSAAAREDVHQTTYLLDKLRTEIAAMSHVFATRIRKQHLKSDTFLTLIQPTHVWGLPEARPRGLPATDVPGSREPAGTRPLDGASGSQTPTRQAIDTILGLQRGSPTGQLILKSRAYLLPEHRRFLGALDDASQVVRGFVERAARPPMTELFNECVQSVQRWRKMHQKRGALYLRGETAEAASGYTSVSGAVRPEAAADPAHHFEEAMQQRLDETTAALFGADEMRPHTVEAAFMYLTPDDRTALLAAAGSRRYAEDEVVLEEGARRHGLFIIREGAVRVSPRHAPGQIVAYLEEGELFGEMSFLENAAATADVIADVPCRIDVVEREAIYELLADRPGFAGRFFQSLATLLSVRLRRTSALLDAAHKMPSGSEPAS